MKPPAMPRVRSEVVNRYCQRLGVVLPLGATLPQAVQALSDAMCDTTDPVVCDQCGATSDAQLPQCPFCGDEDTEVKEETVKKKKRTEAKLAKNKPAAKAKPAAKLAKKPVAKAKPAAKKPVAKAKPKPAAKLAVVASSSTQHKGEDLPKLQSLPTTVTKVYSKELSAGIDRVQALSRAGVECMWDLGHELAKIYEEKLYTQVTAHGKALYDSWNAFCKNEIGIVPAYAFRLMDVSLSFTRAQVAAVGVTKLQLLVRVPEQQREQLLATAAATPRSKIAEEVRRIAGGQTRDTGRNQRFHGTPGPGRAPKTRPESATAPPERSARLTVVRAEPRVVVDLYRRGTTERAFNLNDDLVGIEHCANNVVVHYQVMRTEQGLSLAIETRREHDVPRAARVMENGAAAR